MPYILHDSQLTTAQRNVVELRMNQDHVIVGPPGSGKTQVLLHRARWLAKTHNVHHEQFRIFVYTNVLSNFIRQSLHVLDIPESSVQTFDHWCGDYWDAHRLGARPTLADGKQDYPETRVRVLSHLRGHPPSAASLLRFAVVDEGQDLDETCYEILKLAASHLTVVADSRQQLYEGGSDAARICSALRMQGQSMGLLSGYRNSPGIGKLASYFGQRFEASNHQVDRETPTYRVASDWEDEIRSLAGILRERRLMNQKCAVIVPTKRDAYSIRNKLQALGVEIEAAMPASSGGEVVDFESTVPKISTYHSAKGLTFDSVLLPKLVLGNWKNFGPNLRKRMLLVGITRATQWVYLSSVKGYEMEETSILQQASANGDLYLKSGNAEQSTATINVPKPDNRKIDFL
jgi:superfamily I DNA/RNA helicase